MGGFYTCRSSQAASLRLGWNTWIGSQPFTRDADDPVFEGQELRWVGQENAP